MILALILACIAVILLLVAVLILSLKLVDCEAVNRTVTERLQNMEEAYCRAQNLVYDKFGYRLPMSDKYLSIEEIMLKKAAKGGAQ